MLSASTHLELCRSIRERGFGETLLRQAIGEARRETGIDRTVLQSTMQGFNLISSNRIPRSDEVQYLHPGRLRLFLTICHTRRIMRFWLFCLIAVVGLLPDRSRPRGPLQTRSSHGNTASNGDSCAPVQRV